MRRAPKYPLGMKRSVAVVLGLLVTATLGAGCRKGATDWRVIQLYGGAVSVDLLKHPSKVQMFRVGAERRDPAPGQVHAGPYVASGAPVEIAPADAAALSALFADAATYDWQRVKRVPFSPQTGVWFIRGSYVLELALDLETAQITAYANGQTIAAEDFDAARLQVLAIAQRAFPGDPAIASMK